MNHELNIPSKFEKSIAPWIGKTEKLMNMFMRDSFAKAGVEITKEQFILLAKLEQQDGIKQKDLAYITERNKGSLARLINTMEKKNYVARIPSEVDKRINCIYLTRHGRETFEKIQPIVWNCINKMQQGVTQEEIDTAINIIKKMQLNILTDKNSCIVNL
jgi:DNA-binding MarR family transcriptional regulator